MKSKIVVSLIIPLYNVEKYVKKCVKSINNQTMDKTLFEVIFVNDGCLDNTINIVKDNINPQINYKIMNKDNGGLSDARNYGLKVAQGTYISFIDSDDYVKDTFLEKMYQKIISKDFDFVMCETYWVYENKTKIVNNKFKKCDNKKQIIDNLFYSSIAAWNKIYHRRVFKNNLFTKDLLFEDLDLMFQIIDKYNNIGFINEALYYYTQGRKQSILNKVSNQDFLSYEKIFDKNIKKYENSQYFKYVETYYIRRILLSCIKKYMGTKYEKDVKKLVLKYKKCFPNLKQNVEYTNANILIKFWINAVLTNQYWIVKLFKLIMI